MRESTIQLSQMVSTFRNKSTLNFDPYTCFAQSLERCLRGDRRYSFRDISKNEQHGYAARLSLAMVHCVFRHCVLVLHGCMVVSKMTLATTCSSLFLFPLYTYIIQCTSNSTCSESLSHIPLQEIMGGLLKRTVKLVQQTTQLETVPYYKS